jgi:hypothetical protein
VAEGDHRAQFGSDEQGPIPDLAWSAAPSSETPEPSRVTDEDIRWIEQQVGMGCGAWDMVKASDIITAAWERGPDRAELSHLREAAHAHLTALAAKRTHHFYLTPGCDCHGYDEHNEYLDALDDACALTDTALRAALPETTS